MKRDKYTFCSFECRSLPSAHLSYQKEAVQLPAIYIYIYIVTREILSCSLAFPASACIVPTCPHSTCSDSSSRSHHTLIQLASHHTHIWQCLTLPSSALLASSHIYIMPTQSNFKQSPMINGIVFWAASLLLLNCHHPCIEARFGFWHDRHRDNDDNGTPVVVVGNPSTPVIVVEPNPSGTPTTITIPGAPTITVPSSSTPTVVTVPSTSTPTTPVVTVPGTYNTPTVPVVTVPGVTVPTPTVPVVTVPGVTTPTVPVVTVPTPTTPVVTVPSTTTPTTPVVVTAPSTTTPATPVVTVPGVTVPGTGTPVYVIPGGIIYYYKSPPPPVAESTNLPPLPPNFYYAFPPPLLPTVFPPGIP
ncbi:hypothetical protein GOP47_0020895 [Adiantum capillus-veneris]|uniref:Uncharacterized protein n=1 Tax=Adiantum capillus-veneris TaxID=13818 RepID=A0A9D4Z7W9_ADICA|nr:hypothetical protein GOP47_0020895 [Adiantum capillus-veneris]